MVLIADQEILSLVPLGVSVVLDSVGLPLHAACLDLGKAVRHVVYQLLEEVFALALLAEILSRLYREADDALGMLVGSEPVGGGIKLDEEAVGEDGHGRDDGEHNVADCGIDDGDVGDMGRVCVQEGEGWPVDEGDLCSSDLM